MVTEQWQVTGDASAHYERYLVPAIFRQWAEVLVREVKPHEGATVLDVACGTGIVARTAASVVGQSGKIIGLDLNADMISQARKQSESILVESEWYEASALEIPIANGRIDCVYCQAGLQFFPDRLAALKEMHRVLKPGGAMASVVWRAMEHSPGFASLAAALEKNVGSESAAIMKAPFYFGDSPDELRSIVNDAGFVDTKVKFESRMMRFPSIAGLFDLYTSGSPIAEHVTDIGSRDDIIIDMENDLSGYLDDEGLAFPLEGQVVTAMKAG